MAPMIQAPVLLGDHHLLAGRNRRRAVGGVGLPLLLRALYLQRYVRRSIWIAVSSNLCLVTIPPPRAQSGCALALIQLAFDPVNGRAFDRSSLQTFRWSQ